jgi:hypothetical protein
MTQRIAFFHPEHGIGLRIAAGSGRSWMDLPDGDPVHAHCRIDVPRDTLVPTVEAEPRPSSGTLFVAWAELTRFADDLTALGDTGRAGVVAFGDRHAMLRVRLRRDGRLRAETVFTQGAHVAITVRCATLWDRHYGVRGELAGLAERVRAARAF